jgi:hypothetical protein
MTTIVYVVLGWIACGIASHVTLIFAKKYATKHLHPFLAYVIGPVLVAILVLVSIYQIGRIAWLAVMIRWDVHRVLRRQRAFLLDVRVRTLASCIGCGTPVETVQALDDKPHALACGHTCVSIALEKLHEEEKKKRKARMDAWWAKS